ncbi:hypothetical protein SPBRAN_1234 [uncultured Candidatus Thioglobus sp.]|nr:hypothetical protein SPBRAN_1234 [uncultured Candidatus Thioglobus sp.]
MGSTAVFAQQACVDTTTGLDAMQRKQITLTNDNGEEINLPVLVADNNFTRASGFQHICEYAIKRLFILFRYDHETHGSFHMNNVHAPLDLAVFNSMGKLIHLEYMQVYAEDYDKPLYTPPIPFQFALEATQDFFAKHHISVNGSYLKNFPKQ